MLTFLYFGKPAAVEALCSASRVLTRSAQQGVDALCNAEKLVSLTGLEIHADVR